MTTQERPRLAAWTETFGKRGDVLGVIALGGALGSLARYGVGQAFPDATQGFPWPTLTVNVLGCLLIGLLQEYVTLRSPHRLLRPFLGVGILGGFTTFSTYVVDTLHLGHDGHAAAALVYVLVSLAAGFLAVAVGIGLMGAALRNSVRNGAQA